MRAVIYGRVSTEEQAAHGFSQSEQVRLGRERCEREGWVCDPAEDVFFDAGFSGGRDDRPALLRLLSVLDRYDYLIVWKFDRLTRKTETLTRLLGMFDEMGVRLVSITEPVEVSTAMGRAMIEMLGVFAQLERSHASERTRMGKRASVARGRRNGGPTPYGYRKRDTTEKGKPTGPLVQIPAEATVLRRMHSEVLAGRSMRAVAKALNEDGIRTKQGAHWSQTRISQLLRNPLYSGVNRYKEETYSGEHEPIFSADEWVELQAVLSARRRQPGKGRGRQPHTHLFARAMLRCGCCGGAIVPRRTTNAQGRVYERYRCHGQISGSSPDCTMPSFSREVIDSAVLDYFSTVGLDLGETRRKIIENAEQAVAETSNALNRAERQRALAEDRLARVRRDYQDGRLDPDDWREQRVQLQAEHDAASSEVERLAARADEIAGARTLLDSEQELCDRLTELRLALAGRVIDSATVGGMRTALLRLFDGFTLRPLDEPEEPPALPEGWIRSRTYWHPKLLTCGAGGLYIEPHPRRDMILNEDKEAAFPELRRVALEARVRMPVSRR